MRVLSRPRDRIAVGSSLVLIATSAAVGTWLNRHGYQMVLPRPPLIAYLDPHLGWGTPLAAACVVLGLGLQRVADRLPWRRLLAVGWLLCLSWLCSLALVDGLQRGWVSVLLNPNEYLHDLPRITSAHGFYATFTSHILQGPDTWTTHVAGHPPLATLVFWLLARIGLAGGFWAGTLCILTSSLVSIALPVTLRELGAPAAARRLVPLIALFPGAVWMAVSADGMFAGVALTGLALGCLGASRRRWWLGLLGGLVLGVAVSLSYGLLLFGLVVVVAMGLTIQRHRWRQVVPGWVVAAVAALAVPAAQLAWGFNYLDALRLLRIRYYQGVASDRPYWYFLFADFGAWLVSCSPALAIGLVRACSAVRLIGHNSAVARCAALSLSAVLAVLLADLSGLSKAETERIWLAFGVVAFAGLALVRGRTAHWVLVLTTGTALLVNHLFDTGW